MTQGDDNELLTFFPGLTVGSVDFYSIYGLRNIFTAAKRRGCECREGSGCSVFGMTIMGVHCGKPRQHALWLPLWAPFRVDVHLSLERDI